MICLFFLKHRIQNPSFPAYISPGSLSCNNHPPFSGQISERRDPLLPVYLFSEGWFLPALPACFHHPDQSGSFLMEWKLSDRFVNRTEGGRSLPRSGEVVEWLRVC